MLMMMGSAEALPSAPAEKTKFIEDMSEAEAASAVSRLTNKLLEQSTFRPRTDQRVFNLVVLSSL